LEHVAFRRLRGDPMPVPDEAECARQGARFFVGV